MAVGSIHVLFALVVAACSVEPGALGNDAADPGDDENCASPELRPEWLVPMQDEVVARLAGAQEISAGVRLSDRSTTQGRARAQVYLEVELAAMGYTVQRQEYGSGTNVIVELDGSADSLYVLGTHYDSSLNSPGADNNATGVAAVLAAARFLAEQRCRKHDVLFAFFDQEEEGLKGSRALATKLLDDGRDVLGVYTLDQLGWDMDGDRRIEVHLPSPGAIAAIETSINRHELALSVVETTSTGHDHQSFRALGFPAAALTEEIVSGDATPHAHLETDVYENVDLDYLANSSTLVHALLSDLSLGISPSTATPSKRESL